MKVTLLADPFSAHVIKWANDSHNFYLTFFSDMGLFGLITALLISYIFITENLAFFQSNKNIYLINLGILSFGIGLFIRGLFDSVNILTYGYITIDLPFWILVIIIIYFNINKVSLLNAKY